MSLSTDTDVVIVGAGIVGLATALALQRRLPAAHITVLDKESQPATHQSGRNSGVVHSGLYYPPGSDKSRLVSAGRRLLEAHCREWGVPIDWCGKVVVATSIDQLDALAALEARGVANGVEIERLDAIALHQREPHAIGVAALRVPGAGIVDYRAVAAAMAAQVTDHGGEIRTGTLIDHIDVLPHERGLRLGGAGLSGGELSAGWMVNCAGLQSDRIARLAGCDIGVRIVPFRGEYHELVESARPLVQHLIYPVPDPRWPFLGVHFTRMVDGTVHVGPNAVLALGREAYGGGVVGADAVEMLCDPGLRRLATRYWRTGLTELVRSRSDRLLLRDVQRLVPGVGRTDLVAASPGIRAQAVNYDGTLLDDFAFASSRRAVHVINAPSPAATASLAIGDVVAGRLIDGQHSAGSQNALSQNVLSRDAKRRALRG